MVLLAIFCTFAFVILPIVRGMAANEAQVYDQRIREFRLTWVQKRYPELKKLSWDELERNFPIERLYNNIR